MMIAGRLVDRNSESKIQLKEHITIDSVAASYGLLLTGQLRLGLGHVEVELFGAVEAKHKVSVPRL